MQRTSAQIQARNTIGATARPTAASLIDAVLDAQGPGSGFLAEAAHAWVQSRARSPKGRPSRTPVA